MIVQRCDRCVAEILNEHGAQVVWAAGKAFPPVTSQQWLVTLCANCRCAFEEFIDPYHSLEVQR